MDKLSRAEMIALVEKIMNAVGTEKEISDAVALFDAHCVHPSKNGLIFWPHGFPHDRSKPEPTAAEIVDKAMTPGTVIHL
jgi:hypothetical protein